tara:strand:+ start:436 stop:591 length:156 start_codon:yes stop_codon:yes gene_type:complete
MFDVLQHFICPHLRAPLDRLFFTDGFVVGVLPDHRKETAGDVLGGRQAGHR